MNWPYVIALTLSGLTAISICVVAWGRRSAPAGRPLILLGAAIAIWAFTYAANFVVVNDQAHFFWLRATYLGVLLVPTTFLLYSIQYTNKGFWLKKRVLTLLSIEPFLTFIVLWLDPFGLFFGGQRPIWKILDGGPWFWFNVGYSYLLIIFAIILLLDAYRHTAPPIRRQTGVILLGAFFPWMVDLLGVAGVYNLPNLELTPLALAFTCLTFLVGLSRFKLLDILPIARDALVESMDDGMILLDTLNRIVDINPTALNMIGYQGKMVVGESIEKILAGNEVVERFRDTMDTRQEIVIGDNPREYYDLRISALYDHKGRFSGRLIVARDVTERRLSEQSEHEQRIVAEVLRDMVVALNGSRSFDEILDHLLENVAKIIPYDAANFMSLDPNGIAREVRSCGFEENGLKTGVSNFPARELPNFKTMMETGLALAIPDTRQDKSWVVLEGLEKIRSYVGAPLQKKGEAIGFLNLVGLSPNFYSRVHAERLQPFADQVAITIENTRLFEETRQRAEQMTALFDIGLTVTSGLEMEQVLKTLLQKCQQVLSIEAFYIAILDADSGLIHHPLAYDMGEYPQIPTRDISKSPGLSGYIIQSRQTLYIPDMLAPEAIKTYQIFRTSGTPTRSFVGVPMIVGDRVVGVISMQSYQPNAYDHNQIRLLETIATQAGVAIDNSRLYLKAQQEIRQREKAEHRYRALFEQSHDAVFILDFTGKHLEVNQRAADLLGYSVEELMMISFWDIALQKNGKVMERLLNGVHIPLYESVFRKKNREEVVVEINMELVLDEDGIPLHVQSVVRDISERKQNEVAKQEANLKLQNQLKEIEELQAQLREQAARDSLTGLFNRRYLEETLAREFERAKREKGTVCLIMMDIDGFKAFNDTYGHDAGDLLLRELGELLRSEIRSSDVSCRYGGEEFLVVMPGASLEKGHQRAEDIRAGFLALDIKHMGTRLNATLSLGVAIFPQHGSTWEEVLHNADRAMYAAKAAGKNCTRRAE